MSYNFKRYENYLRDQVIDTKDYSLSILKKVRNLLKSNKLSKEYKLKVNRLIKNSIINPKRDTIIDKELKSFSLENYDIPECTHQLIQFKKDDYEVWSKDIDESNRLIYRVYNSLKIILVIHIEGHELDIKELKSELFDSEVRKFNFVRKDN